MRRLPKHRFTEDDMRNFDLTPLYRATVGFDRIATMMDRALTNDASQPSYPPYNIEKTDEDGYRISVAVAGFTPDELSVEVREATLIIAARKTDDAAPRQFLHRGIATRAFERRFALADHMRVTGARHEHGMLHIELLREMPEALKPRRIDIARSEGPQDQPKIARTPTEDLPRTIET
jgi:molecular chaperone IbpA